MAADPPPPGTMGSSSQRHSVDAIVVAAGSSNRMGGLDKRVVPLAGRPLLAWTLAGIAEAASVERIVLVMGEGAALDDLRPFLPEKVTTIVPGGSHRGASVEAGLAALARLDGAAADPDRVVLVHDGARPLVTAALVEAVATAARDGAAIPTVAVTDTVRRMRDGGLAETVDRTDLVAVQTPQGARAGLLRAAFKRYPSSGPERFTDEATLLAACTIRVHTVAGDPLNLKVTSQADLPRVEALLLARDGSRVGLGTDWHPFGPGTTLRLGGQTIPGAPGLHGHSDGDVALHAVADALLGAAGLGDLGRLFPADTRTPKGISSRDLLAAAVGRLADEGWRPASVDLTIEGARPRLGAHLDAMGETIADLLGVGPERVGVKASTGNLSGDAGAGRGMGATAIATIARGPRIPAPGGAPTLGRPPGSNA
jgi:2-C-methyl-D-erythritol 4-phosphate cytidylyltransferase/2-C-methyl-D-erythritol 2,4-cyclodiphosphate synthase